MAGALERTDREGGIRRTLSPRGTVPARVMASTKVFALGAWARVGRLSPLKGLCEEVFFLVTGSARGSSEEGGGMAEAGC